MGDETRGSCEGRSALGVVSDGGGSSTVGVIISSEGQCVRGRRYSFGRLDLLSVLPRSAARPIARLPFTDCGAQPPPPGHFRSLRMAEQCEGMRTAQHLPWRRRPSGRHPERRERGVAGRDAGTCASARLRRRRTVKLNVDGAGCAGSSARPWQLGRRARWAHPLACSARRPPLRTHRARGNDQQDRLPQGLASSVCAARSTSHRFVTGPKVPGHSRTISTTLPLCCPATFARVASSQAGASAAGSSRNPAARYSGASSANGNA